MVSNLERVLVSLVLLGLLNGSLQYVFLHSLVDFGVDLQSRKKRRSIRTFQWEDVLKLLTGCVHISKE